MVGFTAAALFAAVVLKLSDLAKFIQAKKWASVETQVGVFAVGIIAVVLAAHSNFAGGIALAGVTLKEANWGAQVLIGLVAGSSAGVLYDAKRAIDNSDSAATSPSE